MRSLILFSTTKRAVSTSTQHTALDDWEPEKLLLEYGLLRFNWTDGTWQNSRDTTGLGEMGTWCSIGSASGAKDK